MSFKLILLVRTDLNMSKGKIIAQTAHATVDATITSYSNTPYFWKWRNNGETIISLKIQSEEMLLTLMKKAKKNKINHGYVTDKGLTEVQSGTITVGYIGPDFNTNINKITGNLKLL